MKTAALLLLAAFAAAPAAAADARTGGARFLALGDSYTAGTSVPARDAWPWQLSVLLRQNNVSCQDPVVIAHEGWTADELVAGFDAAKPTGTFDLVTVMVGVNNQFRGGSIERYRRQLDAVFRRALAAAGGDAHRVVGLTIPDYGVTPFAAGHDAAHIAREIDDFNKAFREEANRRGVRVVNVTTVSRFARTNRTLVSEDGLHPSARLHALWARLVLPAARAALQPAAKR